MNESVHNHECFLDWQTVFKDIDAIQIILYLRKYNPNIDTSTIIKNLLIDEDKVIEILHGLSRLDAVKFSKPNNTWALTSRGKNVAECLMGLK